MNELSLYRAHVDIYSHLVSNRFIFFKTILKNFIYSYTFLIYLYIPQYNLSTPYEILFRKERIQLMNIVLQM